MGDGSLCHRLLMVLSVRFVGEMRGMQNQTIKMMLLVSAAIFEQRSK